MIYNSKNWIQLSFIKDFTTRHDSNWLYRKANTRYSADLKLVNTSGKLNYPSLIIELLPVE